MEGKPGRYWFDREESLKRAERIVLLILVGFFISVDIIALLTSSSVDVLGTALSIAMTFSLVLYIWSPVLATGTLGVVVAAAFISGEAVDILLAGSVAALPVVRLGTTPLIIAYTGGLLVSTSLLSSGYGTGSSQPASVTALLTVATFAGLIGLSLRLTHARGRRLELELAEQEEREHQAVLAERRWIAGELHDSIAHHLTVISMHVQMLDDEKVREGSQEAIRVAARKALSDLRFVIKLADDAPRGAEVPTGDLAAAIDEAFEEFEATGHSTVCEGDPTDAAIPRGIEIILARVVRESATNILKYAGPGEVRVTLDVDEDLVTMTIRSPIPDTPRRDLPSTGTGLNRMAERVLGVSGEFSAGPVDDVWLVTARLPRASMTKQFSPTS